MFSLNYSHDKEASGCHTRNTPPSTKNIKNHPFCASECKGYEASSGSTNAAPKFKNEEKLCQYLYFPAFCVKALRKVKIRCKSPKEKEKLSTQKCFPALEQKPLVVGRDAANTTYTKFKSCYSSKNEFGALPEHLNHNVKSFITP